MTVSPCHSCRTFPCLLISRREDVLRRTGSGTPIPAVLILTPCLGLPSRRTRSLSRTLSSLTKSSSVKSTPGRTSTNAASSTIYTPLLKPEGHLRDPPLATPIVLACRPTQWLTLYKHTLSHCRLDPRNRSQSPINCVRKSKKSKIACYCNGQDREYPSRSHPRPALYRLRQILQSTS